jgi:hypothetical protein
LVYFHLFAHRCALQGHSNLNFAMTPKNPAAVALGRKGGKATARKLTPEQRRESARRAAQARWAKKKKNQ